MTAPNDTVVVVGAGASPLVAELLQSGRSVIATDISPLALDMLRAEIGGTPDVQWIVGDVRELVLDAPVAAWHDRAVFHFLTAPEDQAAYAQAAAAAVVPGGHVVIAAFAPSGPTMCSGLPTTRHDVGSLVAVFGDAFELVESFEADHATPGGATQRFTHAVLRRR